MPEVSALAAKVLLAAFFLSFVFGAIAQRTHFCTMGALSDAYNMGDTTRLRQWALAAGVAILGGAMFGFGMVLASGCGSKNLIRLGSGNLKALVVFIVLGISAFATLKGITAVLRVNTVDKIAVDFAGPALLPVGLAALAGFKLHVAGLVLAVLVGGGLAAWALLGRGFRTFDNLLAGLGVGAVIVGAWWVSAHLGHVAEHPQTLEEAFLATNSGRAEALSFVSPIAYTLDWLMFFSDQSKVLTVGIVSVAGVIAGSFVMSLLARDFRWEGFGGTEDVANHLAGGLLMGVGGVTAMGCTIGQGLSGVSTLSATSFVAVAGIVLGAIAAFRYQMWRIESMG